MINVEIYGPGFIIEKFKTHRLNFRALEIYCGYIKSLECYIDGQLFYVGECNV